MISQRVSRALNLTFLLQSGHVATADQLAQLLRCSRRTVFRYINLLKESGLQVKFDACQGGYVVPAPDITPNEQLGDEELVALLLAAALSPLARVEGFDQPVHQAISKLMGWTGQETRSKVNNLVRAPIFNTCYPRIPSKKVAIFKMLAHAFASHEQLQVTYMPDGNGNNGSTHMCPYQLLIADDQWTLIARSSRERKVISVDLEQIESVEPLDQTYRVPLRFLQNGHTGTPRMRAVATGPHTPSQADVTVPSGG